MALECGNTGMPAWPDGQQRFYTRQHWTENGVPNEEMWGVPAARLRTDVGQA